MRGQRIDAAELHCEWVVATLHPFAVLRASDREAAFAGLVADLAVAAKALSG